MYCIEQNQVKMHFEKVQNKYCPLPYDLSYYCPDAILCAPHRDRLSTHRGQLLKVLQQLNHFDTCTCGEQRVAVGGKRISDSSTKSGINSH